MTKGKTDTQEQGNGPMDKSIPQPPIGCPDYLRWQPSSNKGSGFTMVEDRAGVGGGLTRNKTPGGDPRPSRFHLMITSPVTMPNFKGTEK